jgi:ABC-type xylose transport system permease subunit
LYFKYSLNLPNTPNYKSALASNPVAELSLVERVMAPTPKFFKTLRTIGLVIGLVGGAILASPVVLPAAIVTVGGYLALAGSIVTGVSQTAVGKE